MDLVVAAKFKENNCDYIKLAPSHTSKGQSWDNQTGFRDWKGRLANMIKKNTQVDNPHLEQEMKQMFVAFTTAFPEVEITSKFKKKMIAATQLLVHSMKDAISGPKLMKGFVNTGQHVLGSASPNETTSYEKMMKCTNATGITADEYAAMKALRPQAHTEILRTGNS
jgi:hypothetical protein